MLKKLSSMKQIGLLCIGICNEKENLGFSDFLSSDELWIRCIYRKEIRQKQVILLEKENSTSC